MESKTATVLNTDLVQTISERLNNTVSKPIINDAVFLICEALETAAYRDRSFSIVNFGTISTYIQNSGMGLNLSSGNLEKAPPTKLVKFIPHPIFTDLFRQYQKKMDTEVKKT
mgnify:FL=1